MFDAMNRVCTGGEKSAACSTSLEFPTARAVSTTPNAISHGVARRTPSSATAASGINTAQSIMPLDATNPPSATCSNAGRISHIASWVVRKMPNRWVRDRRSSPASVTT